MVRGNKPCEVLEEGESLFQEEKDLWPHGGTKRPVYLHPPAEVGEW